MLYCIQRSLGTTVTACAKSKNSPLVKWLVKQVEALFGDLGCHFVVLTGGPGVGKTAFLAYLAATHPGWPRYLIRRDSCGLRTGDASTFLLTIGGQLATLYPYLFYPENLELVVRQRLA